MDARWGPPTSAISPAPGTQFATCRPHTGVPLVIFPSVFLSGLLISVDRLPGWAQLLSRATPIYYANRVIQKLIQPGGAIGDDWAGFAGLPLYGTILIVLATLTLRERD